MNSLVTMSNFVGKTIDLAAETGLFRYPDCRSHGKTREDRKRDHEHHSREADGRMDTMLSCALSAGTEDLELLEDPEIQHDG